MSQRGVSPARRRGARVSRARKPDDAPSDPRAERVQPRRDPEHPVVGRVGIDELVRDDAPRLGPRDGARRVGQRHEDGVVHEVAELERVQVLQARQDERCAWAVADLCGRGEEGGEGRVRGVRASEGERGEGRTHEDDGPLALHLLLEDLGEEHACLARLVLRDDERQASASPRPSARGEPVRAQRSRRTLHWVNSLSNVVVALLKTVSGRATPA